MTCVFQFSDNRCIHLVNDLECVLMLPSMFTYCLHGVFHDSSKLLDIYIDIHGHRSHHLHAHFEYHLSLDLVKSLARVELLQRSYLLFNASYFILVVFDGLLKLNDFLFHRI